MVASIFYFIGLILFLFNFIILMNLSKYFYVREFVAKFKKVTGKNPESSDFADQNFGFFSLILLTEVFNFTWFFLGTIGQNWIVFLGYFLILPILAFGINTPKIKFITNFFISLKVIFVVFLLGFLVFNHFHLHLNLAKLILQ
jgi:hypothetical protein